MLARLDRFATWITDWTPPWWAWPAALLVLALAADVASLAFVPLDESWVGWRSGERLGETCLMIQQTGLPCPQCGMTRSWVFGARGDVLAAWRYNPAGITLWLWINAGGLVGAARLIARSGRRFPVPTALLFGWTLVWLVGLYGVGFGLRIAGVNMLPGTRAWGDPWPPAELTAPAPEGAPPAAPP